jgi:hypothetical protein
MVSNMKIKYLVLIGAAALPAIAFNLIAQSRAGGLVVHEWGTFTSFQGGDGKLLEWRPLVTSELPNFVYNWNKDSYGRRAADPMLLFGKGGVSSLQRMETPVIYFYADKEETVDVSIHSADVRFTEWFPQAAQIGPSFMASNAPVHAPKSAATRESMIRWPQVRVVPASADGASGDPLPMDKSGSHYFAARETDADMLEMADAPPVTQQPEREKFLFYRGVAHFATPLRVTMKSDNVLDLANTGNEPMAHLFVLDIKGTEGSFVYVPALAPGGSNSVNINYPDETLPLDKLGEQLAGKMASALASTGLYPREAAAMVKTWKDSWFKEPGVRVLYVLPRAWTDRELAITLNPAPRELVRTMVGRAEVLSPDVERDLAALMDKIGKGDAGATAEAREIVKGLGRFAEPALYHVFAAANPRPDVREKMLAIMISAPRFE